MVRTRPRLAAVNEAAIEGKLLRKTGFVIGRRVKRVIAGLDKRIGNLTRELVYANMPIESKKVLFITFQGEYTCNQKYITEELLRRGFDGDIVWSLRKTSIQRIEEGQLPFPAQARYVEQYTEAFFDELSTAQVWVANSVDFLKRRIPKKKDQFFIETWHGSLGLKRFDASVNKGKAWVKAAQLCGQYTDVLISNSDFESDIYRSTYWPTTPIEQYGHPRNDVFFRTDIDIDELKVRVGEIYGFNPDARIALYAPTFRDDHEFGCYCLNPDEMKSALEQRFGGEWTVLTKYHPTVSKYVAKKAKSSLGINVTDYSDIQELMLIADVAITDYSSWIYDFMLSGKPCFIFAADLDHYCEEERGFCYPLETTPFAIAKNNEELVDAIAAFDADEYGRKLDAFLRGKGCVDDGFASKRVADLIESVTERGDVQDRVEVLSQKD